MNLLNPFWINFYSFCKMIRFTEKSELLQKNRFVLFHWIGSLGSIRQEKVILSRMVWFTEKRMFEPLEIVYFFSVNHVIWLSTSIWFDSQMIWFTVKRQLIQITYLGLSKRVDSESSYAIYWKEQTWKRNSWLSSVNQITWLGSSKRIDSESTESGHLAQFIGKSRLWVKSCHLLKRANSLEQQLALFTESDRFARLIKSIESNDLIH